jgi:hypothetical protein
MRKDLYVNINKTVDENLDDLIPNVTGRYLTRTELNREKPSYKLVVYQFSGPLYDLCDFEV